MDVTGTRAIYSTVAGLVLMSSLEEAVEMAMTVLKISKSGGSLRSLSAKYNKHVVAYFDDEIIDNCSASAPLKENHGQQPVPSRT